MATFILLSSIRKPRLPFRVPLEFARTQEIMMMSFS